MHYEVELRELTYEADGTGGLRVTDSMWKPVRVFDKDAVPMPLTFDDPPNAGLPYRAADEAADARAVRIAEQVLALVLPLLGRR